jgi:hypothetical protein
LLADVDGFACRSDSAGIACGKSCLAAGAQFATPPASPDQVLRIDDVWVRRTATVCFPAAGDALSSAAALQDFVVIETGGENHEDQFDRLRFLMRELQRPEGG